MSRAITLRPGRRLGRYECLAQLGRGGMATVWAARVRGPHGFQKLVALKVMLPTTADDDHEAMFYDEARIASRIRHPNVVETFDLGDHNGSPFIAMELLEGESLSGLCRATPGRALPLPAALRVAVDACAGLHAAHILADESGTPLAVVHRDVTPHNLFVTRHGVTKITDFGIAKALGKLSQQTHTGILKGKLAYMPPEQLVRGRPLDARADIFSLAVSLYEATTGVRPFGSDAPRDVATRARGGAIEPPSRAVPWPYPPQLEAALLRALSPDPEARYATAEAFGEALDGVARREVGAASARDVAQLLETAAGPSVRGRADEVRRAIEELDAAAEPAAPPPAAPHVPSRFEAETVDAPLRPHAGPSMPTPTGVSRTGGLSPQRPNRRRTALVAVALALSTAGAAVTHLRARRARPEAMPQTSAPAGSASPPSSAPPSPPSSGPAPPAASGGRAPTAEPAGRAPEPQNVAPPPSGWPPPKQGPAPLKAKRPRRPG